MKKYIKSAVKSLSEDDIYTKYEVAQRSTRKEDLWLLAKDSNWDIRHTLTYNENLPADILTYLANDSMPSIRCRVAAHPNTPSDTLSLLIYDGSSDVRRNVAQNPNTPIEILYKLAEDSNRSVRAALVQNSSLPMDFRKATASDVDYCMYFCVYFDVRDEDELSWDEPNELADSIQKRLESGGYIVIDYWVDDDVDQEDAPDGILWYRAVVRCREIYTDDEAEKVISIIKDQIVYFDENFFPNDYYYDPECGISFN